MNVSFLSYNLLNLARFIIYSFSRSSINTILSGNLTKVWFDVLLHEESHPFKNIFSHVYVTSNFLSEYTKKCTKMYRTIMPSKYTDEIENSSDTWRVFLIMGRRAKFSVQQKLIIIKKAQTESIERLAQEYCVNAHTIRRWKRMYKYQGMRGLESAHHNKVYSVEFKRKLVVEFEHSTDTLEKFALKHGLKSDWQLSQWIIQYNESKLKAYTPRKRDSIMPGRKTTFEERLSIIEDLIKHDVNYSWAVDKYHVSYQQVYGWYQKYRKSGNDPQSLRDRRGKAKPKAEWTELDKLRAENRLLKAEVKRNEMEVAFAKKLIEIRNREAKSSSNNKPSKN